MKEGGATEAERSYCRRRNSTVGRSYCSRGELVSEKTAAGGSAAISAERSYYKREELLQDGGAIYCREELLQKEETIAAARE
jgi:hypothetical protein